MLCAAILLILAQTDAFVCKRSIRRAGPVAATTEPSSLAPVLSPSANRPERWDSACVANPVVLKPGSGEDRWKMFYYGNNGNWSDGTVGFLPTGTSGLAESADGVSWTKVDGPRADGSVFGPADDVDAWDGLHTGVGDVIREDDGSLLMFYFGGGGKAANAAGKGFRGLGMQIGRARSVDGGRSWTRCGSGADGAGPVLEARAEEGLFASCEAAFKHPSIGIHRCDPITRRWPRILRYDDKWVMLYHAFNGTHWRAFSATSTDLGLSWSDRRLALDVGPAGAFDETGVGTRSVIKRGDHALMVYEGVDGGGTFSGTHRLGAATSSDGGRTWARVGDGQAIVAPGIAPLGAWTAQVVGTPYLVADGDALRLYHCAKQNSETNMSIGLLISESGNVAAGAWRGVM
jgi:hypothetical protein